MPVATIRRLVGVYNARGTVSGELAYFIGARLGRAHCALCEVTHGLVRERPEWKQCRQTLAVPFAMYHLNDRPLAVSTACGGVAPVVAPLGPLVRQAYVPLTRLPLLAVKKPLESVVKLPIS